MSVEARVYEHDKRTAMVCKQMQQVGFKFDPERGAILSEHLKRVEDRTAESVRRVVGYDINLLSPNQMQWAFFDRLRAPIYFRSQLSGRPSLGVDAMRGYAMSARGDLSSAALGVLEYRRARVLRRMYIERIKLGVDGRVHPVWLNYGTVSGRWSSQQPNMQNLVHTTRDPTNPKAEGFVYEGVDVGTGGIRAQYLAEPGYRLVVFDFGQLEMRIAAYASGDQNMIASCESSDIHAGNAAQVFGDAFDAEAYASGESVIGADRFSQLKFLRQLAKQSGFAVCYGADASTVHARIVAEGKNVTLREVEGMLRRIKSRFVDYYRWQDRNLNACIREGYVSSPLLGRRRHLGHAPSPTEAMNFPIQSGAADVTNAKMLAILDRMPEGCRLVAQVHDSCTFEALDSQVDALIRVIQDVCAEPVTFTTSGRALEAVFPIDLEVIDRWN